MGVLRPLKRRKTSQGSSLLFDQNGRFRSSPFSPEVLVLYYLERSQSILPEEQKVSDACLTTPLPLYVLAVRQKKE